MDNIPFVLVGGGLDFKMGRSLKYSEGAAQPPADGVRARLRPPRQDVRQPEPLRRRGAHRADVRRAPKRQHRARLLRAVFVFTPKGLYSSAQGQHATCASPPWVTYAARRRLRSRVSFGFPRVALR